MDKNEQQILVVDTKALFGDDYFTDFQVASTVDFEGRILANQKIMKRGLAEEDPSHKQPIAYAIIANPTTGKIFAYQRAAAGNYDENRLAGKWSWGVGGHIEACDTQSDNLIHASLLRELDEELVIKGSTKPRVLGYINDDSNDVGKVHFGILYWVETDATEITLNDQENQQGHLMELKDLKDLLDSPNAEVEAWSRIAYAPLAALM